MAAIRSKPSYFKKEINNVTFSLSTNQRKTQSKELIITPQMFLDDSVQQILLAFHSTIKDDHYRIMNVAYVDVGTFFKLNVSKKNLPDTIYT